MNDMIILFLINNFKSKPLFLFGLLNIIIIIKNGVWGLGFGVWGLGFGVWGLGFRV